MDFEDGDAGGYFQEAVEGGVGSDVVAEEGAYFPGPLLEVETDDVGLVGVGEFFGAEGFGGAAYAEGAFAAGAEVADPLDVTARGDQVALAVEDEQVDRVAAPLAGLAAADREHPAAHQADAQVGQCRRPAC